MKDDTNLCSMCKLLVKALGTRKRDTPHAQPLLQRAGLLAGDRTNFSNHDSQQSVLWD